MSPKENNKKRINNRGKVPVTSSRTEPVQSARRTASPPPKALSDTTKIILERRIAELRTEIAVASKQGNHQRADRLHGELIAHQATLGFTPDDPPPKPKAPRKEESLGRQRCPTGPHPRKSERPLTRLAAHWDGRSKMKISELADQVRGIPLRDVLERYGFEVKPEGTTLRAKERASQHRRHRQPVVR